MTEETNLQLNKLVESIDGVSGQLELLAENASSPDWWSVIATILAAIAAAVITYVLGRRQNELQQQQLKLQEQQNEIQKYQTKLQEQQVRAQEYEILKRLYILVSKANRLIDNFIEDYSKNNHNFNNINKVFKKTIEYNYTKTANNDYLANIIR